MGPRRDEVTGEWRKLHKDGLYGLYYSSDIVQVITWRRMRWEWHVARVGERRGVYRVLMWKPQGKRPLGRAGHRWKDNVKMDSSDIVQVITSRRKRWEWHVARGGE